MSLDATPPTEGALILYRTDDDAVRVEVLHESDTFWLDQRRMAELFGVEVFRDMLRARSVYVCEACQPRLESGADA